MNKKIWTVEKKTLTIWPLFDTPCQLWAKSRLRTCCTFKPFIGKVPIHWGTLAKKLKAKKKQLNTIYVLTYFGITYSACKMHGKRIKNYVCAACRILKHLWFVGKQEQSRCRRSSCPLQNDAILTNLIIRELRFNWPKVQAT